MDIFNEFIKGSQRALARLITLAENFDGEGFAIMARLEAYYSENQPADRNAKKQVIIGITGPPGAGKSSLVDRLARHIASVSGGASVAVAAFDPSSPFTGGAILGDRVRMSNFTSSDFYFRSMGTRGSQGGMSRAVPYVLRIYELFGFDYIIIETVGVGQLEIDVVKMSDTTIITEVPGLGDEIQAIKAGLFEIGDIFVVNKIDRPGVEKVFCEINYMLNLRRERANAPENAGTGWKVPIVKTNCVTGEGIEELFNAINLHRDHIYGDGRISENRAIRLREQYINFIKDFIEESVLDELNGSARFAGLLAAGGNNSASGEGFDFKSVMMETAEALYARVKKL